MVKIDPKTRVLESAPFEAREVDPEYLREMASWFQKWAAVFEKEDRMSDPDANSRGDIWLFEKHGNEDEVFAVKYQRLGDGTRMKTRGPFRIVEIRPRKAFWCPVCEMKKGGLAWRPAPGEWTGCGSSRFCDGCVQGGRRVQTLKLVWSAT